MVDGEAGAMTADRAARDDAREKIAGVLRAHVRSAPGGEQCGVVFELLMLLQRFQVGDRVNVRSGGLWIGMGEVLCVQPFMHGGATYRVRMMVDVPTSYRGPMEQVFCESELFPAEMGR